LFDILRTALQRLSIKLIAVATRPVTSLGYQAGRRVFWGAQIF